MLNRHFKVKHCKFKWSDITNSCVGWKFRLGLLYGVPQKEVFLPWITIYILQDIKITWHIKHYLQVYDFGLLPMMFTFIELENISVK